MRRRGTVLIAPWLYGLLVLLGTALLGFVVAPFLGIASGYFPIEAEARAVFSLATLKGFPLLLGLSVLSGALYPAFAERRLPVRVLILAANVTGVWLIGAGFALVVLG